MRRSGLIVADTLTKLRSLVEPGITTLELDAVAESNIRSAGAIPTFKGYHGFPASICASVNDEVVHGIPSTRRLKEGDVIKIDCGATLDGYVGDAAISVLVGKVSGEWQRLVDVTRVSLLKAIEKMVPETISMTCRPRFRIMSKPMASVLFEIFVATVLDRECTRILRFLTMADQAPVLF